MTIDLGKISEIGERFTSRHGLALVLVFLLMLGGGWLIYLAFDHFASQLVRTREVLETRVMGGMSTLRELRARDAETLARIETTQKAWLPIINRLADELEARRMEDNARAEREKKALKKKRR